MVAASGSQSRPAPALPVLLLAVAMAILGCSTVAHAQRVPPARCDEDLTAIYERLAPAVVSITATSINPWRLTERVKRSVGSGFLFSGDGTVVTNAHLVFGRQTIVVTLDDGRRLPAELVGADPIFDVALLRLRPPGADSAELPAMVLGDSDQVRVGEEVAAIGNPLGLEQTLTRGVISAVNRILPETPFSLLQPLIQTDTPINPGSSGGPLLNRCGAVVGVTTAAFPDAQNIGFAIPINLVRVLMPSLAAHGRVIRPWIGFHGQLIGVELQDLLRTPLTEGLLVEVVEPGSPAASAGIRGGQLEIVVDGQAWLLGGDIVTVINGVRIDSLTALTETMRAVTVGERLRLQVYRDGATRAVEYDVPERPLLVNDFLGGVVRDADPPGGARLLKWGARRGAPAALVHPR